jgi:hypothetical protein
VSRHTGCREMHARVARARAVVGPFRVPKLTASVSGRSSAPKLPSSYFPGSAFTTNSLNLNILRESSGLAHEK